MSYYGPTEIRDAVDRLICAGAGVGKALHLICKGCASGEVRWDCAPVWRKPSDYRYGPKSLAEWHDAVIELDHGIVRCGEHWYQLPKIHWGDLIAWRDGGQELVRQLQAPIGLEELCPENAAAFEGTAEASAQTGASMAKTLCGEATIPKLSDKKLAAALDEWANNRWGPDFIKLPGWEDLLRLAQLEFKDSRITRKHARKLRLDHATKEAKVGGAPTHKPLTNR